MKHSNRIFEKVNNLLSANNEAEKIYSEISRTISGESLKKFFKERKIKRHNFNKVLINELDRHNIIPKSATTFSNYNNKMKFKGSGINILNSGDQFQIEVIRLKNESLNRYNDLLLEISLPLSLCKALSKQRDDIQAAMLILAKNKELVY